MSKRNGSKSHKVSEVYRFENSMKLRLHLDLTHKNVRNSLNFLDTRLTFWIYSNFYACENSVMNIILFSLIF